MDGVPASYARTCRYSRAAMAAPPHPGNDAAYSLLRRATNRHADDPVLLSLQNHTRHAMPMQAIGRTRLVRNDVAVHVWTNVPVPGGEGGHTNRRLHTNHHPSSVGVDLPDSLPTPMLGWVARAGGDGRDR